MEENNNKYLLLCNVTYDANLSKVDTTNNNRLDELKEQKLDPSALNFIDALGLRRYRDIIAGRNGMIRFGFIERVRPNHGRLN